MTGKMEKDCRAIPKQKRIQPILYADLEKASRLSDGNLNILKVICESFIQECPVKLEAFEQVTEKKDMITMERIAHILKSSAYTLCADLAVEAAMELERACQSGDWDEAEKKIPAFQKAFLSLKQFIEAHIARIQIDA